MVVIESLLSTALQLGAIYSLAVLGLVLSFRITGFADLTIEGSFTSGAAIACLSILIGISPLLSFLLAIVVGAIAGTCTALLYTKVGVNKLLAGIIMMTALYSINLRIMGIYNFFQKSIQGSALQTNLFNAIRPNLPLLSVETYFDRIGSQPLKVIVLIIIALFFLCLIWLFLSTRFGLFLRATGENPKVVTTSGFSTTPFIIAGLALSNALIALGGAIFAQNIGYTDIGMSVGLIVSALASLVIGEALLRPTTILRLLLAALVGSILYQLIIAVALQFNIAPTDMKLATALLLIISIIARKWTQKGKPNENIGAQLL